MSNKLSAIVQTKEGWYGISFAARERHVEDFTLFTGRSLEELKKLFANVPHAVALPDTSGYLVDLTFPFSGRRRISLVIRSELDQVLPAASDDLFFDFKETGRGKVLAAAVPKAVMNGMDRNTQVKTVTFQALAALYALRWFHVIPQNDYIFVHVNGDAVTIVAYRNGNLTTLRQFFDNGTDNGALSTSLMEGLSEVVKERGVETRTLFLVSDRPDPEAMKASIASAFRLVVSVPSLSAYVSGQEVTDSLWPGVGSALLSKYGKSEINLRTKTRVFLDLSSRLPFYVTGCLALLGIIVCGLASLDYYLKSRVYRQLAAEPAKIWNQVFPKIPAVRDVGKMFQEKLAVLEKSPEVAGRSVTPLSILDAVSASIDSQTDVKLNEFVVEANEFSFSGTTVSFAAVEKIKAAVEKIRGVTSLEIQSLDLAPNRQVKFKMKGKL